MPEIEHERDLNLKTLIPSITGLLDSRENNVLGISAHAAASFLKISERDHSSRDRSSRDRSSRDRSWRDRSWRDHSSRDRSGGGGCGVTSTHQNTGKLRGEVKSYDGFQTGRHLGASRTMCQHC